MGEGEGSLGVSLDFRVDIFPTSFLRNPFLFYRMYHVSSCLCSKLPPFPTHTAFLCHGQGRQFKQEEVLFPTPIMPLTDVTNRRIVRKGKKLSSGLKRKSILLSPEDKSSSEDEDFATQERIRRPFFILSPSDDDDIPPQKKARRASPQSPEVPQARDSDRQIVPSKESSQEASSGTPPGDSSDSSYSAESDSDFEVSNRRSGKRKTTGKKSKRAGVELKLTPVSRKKGNGSGKFKKADRKTKGTEKSGRILMSVEDINFAARRAGSPPPLSGISRKKSRGPAKKVSRAKSIARQRRRSAHSLFKQHSEGDSSQSSDTFEDIEEFIASNANH